MMANTKLLLTTDRVSVAMAVVAETTDPVARVNAEAEVATVVVIVEVVVSQEAVEAEAAVVVAEIAP